MKVEISSPNFFLPVLTFACQIWTVKLGLLSLPILFFLIFGTATLVIVKLEKIYLLLILILSFSLVGANLKDGAGVFHYSYYFGAITIYMALIFFCMTQTVSKKASQDLGTTYFLAIILAFGAAAITTPEKLFIASDGNVGFFNEKGLFSYYVTLMASSYWFVKRNLSSILLVMLVTTYCLTIQEATRAILPLTAVILISLSAREFSARIYLFSTLFFLLLLYFSIDPLVDKMAMMLAGNGIDGRYAASSMLIEQGFNNLLMGNGFHSYIGNRFEVLPMPGDFPYDYPGSMGLEMLYEIGIPLTLMMIALVTKAVFGRIDLLGWTSVSIIFATGGKQDVLMWYTLLVFCYLQKYSKEPPLNHSTPSTLTKVA